MGLDVMKVDGESINLCNWCDRKGRKGREKRLVRPKRSLRDKPPDVKATFVLRFSLKSK